MQQCGCVDEFNDCGKVNVTLSAVSAGARGEQYAEWTQTLAAAIDDVVPDLVNQDNVGLKSAQDQGVHGLRVLGDGVSNRGKVHAYEGSVDNGGGC
jgi:hypothetical protein